MGQKLNVMYLHLAKISIYAKTWAFLLPVLKGLTKILVSKEVPTSHMFNTTNGLLARGMWGCLCVRTEWPLMGSFWSPEGLQGEMGCAVHAWTMAPAQGRSSLGTPAATPPPEQWGVPVLCGIWACCDRAHRHSWTLSNTKIWAGSSSAPFPDISIEKASAGKAFLTHLSLSFPFLSGGQVFITQAPRNSLHEQENSWAWSRLAPEEPCCWLICSTLLNWIFNLKIL